MKLKALTILCAFGFVFASTAAAQHTVSGTVTASDDGNPLPGVTVLYQGTTIGTATNSDGKYELNVPSDTGTLVFSSIGFNQQEVAINGRSVINVEMMAGVTELSEVVVTGYGNVEKQNFTGSVSTVSSESFENIPAVSVDQVLKGNVTGASISASTGTPGAVQQIRIRGLSSINAGVSPLYVIDGVPVVSGSNAASGATSSLGVLANLSPSDIKSVTILKDASSTAPYGARGSNGVIVIETKDGREGDVTYSVAMQRGFNDRAVAGPGALNAEQWDQLYYDATGNYLQRFGLEGTRDQVDNFIGSSGWDGETNTNWGDVVTNDAAVQQSYDISARGGNESTTFYASAGFFEQQGQTIGTSLDRISGKLNIQHRFDDRVRLNNSFNGSYVNQDGILEGAGYFGNPVLSEFFLPPIYKVYNDDGSPKTDSFGTFLYNPVAVQEMDIDRKTNYRLINNTTVDVNIMENLSFTTNFSIDYILTEEKYYNNPYYGDSEDVRGSVSDYDTRNFNYVWRNNLQYVFQPKEDHLFDVKLISESQRNYNRFLGAYGEGYAAAGLVNLASTASPNWVSGSTSDWAVQSFTGLVNYTFSDKVLADVSLRREGNSRFSEAKRWGTFWSVGLGYKLTEEEFFQDMEWLDFLKVRASYGLTGNASIGLNNYQALASFTGSYNNYPNFQPGQLGNSGLTWEKAKSLDIGVEFEALDRISGSVVAFKKNSYDLLFNVPLSRTTGHSSQLQNSGELYNKGLEVELNANIVQGKNFAWSLGGNFTTLKNEITELPVDLNGEPVEITTSTRYRAVVGYAVDSWFMKEWAGVDPANGDPLWYMDDGNGGRTTTNDYNAADEYYQGGNAQPTKFGGFNTRFDAYGFTVSADLYYAFGHKVYDSWAFYMKSDGAYSPFFGQYASMTDYWEEPGDIAKNPKPIAFIGNKNSSSTSSRRLYDGDYLRLSSLNVGYNIPAKYLENVGLKSAMVYFNGTNLWTYTFDEDLKYDPDTPANGFLDLNSAPLKSITFGIKANF